MMLRELPTTHEDIIDSAVNQIVKSVTHAIFQLSLQVASTKHLKNSDVAKLIRLGKLQLQADGYLAGDDDIAPGLPPTSTPTTRPDSPHIRQQQRKHHTRAADDVAAAKPPRREKKHGRFKRNLWRRLKRLPLQ